MQIPATMVAPPMKLADGELVLIAEPTMRRKGIFGNLYGQLYITNQRLAFVKAIMGGGLIGAAASKLGAVPKISLPLTSITSVEKQTLLRNQPGIAVTSNGKTEKFVLDELGVEKVVAALVR